MQYGHFYEIWNHLFSCLFLIWLHCIFTSWVKCSRWDILLNLNLSLVTTGKLNNLQELSSDPYHLVNFLLDPDGSIYLQSSAWCCYTRFCDDCANISICSVGTHHLTSSKEKGPRGVRGPYIRNNSVTKTNHRSRHICVALGWSNCGMKTLRLLWGKNIDAPHLPPQHLG